MIIGAAAITLGLLGMGVFVAVRSKANQELKKFQRSVKSGRSYSI